MQVVWYAKKNDEFVQGVVMELLKRCALCNGYKSLSSQQKVRIGMIAIFFLVFILLGLVHSSWGFIHDDFGVLWHSKVNSWKDIFKFFYENSTLCVVQPSNYQIPPQSFFSVYYRPLSYVFYALQMYFFNFEPYGYFLVCIFIHALNPH